MFIFRTISFLLSIQPTLMPSVRVVTDNVDMDDDDDDDDDDGMPGTSITRLCNKYTIVGLRLKND